MWSSAVARTSAWEGAGRWSTVATGGARVRERASKRLARWTRRTRCGGRQGRERGLHGQGQGLPREQSERATRTVKALVWFWLIDETLSANLVYQSDCEIGSTTPSDEAMAKIITMVMAW